MHPTFFEKREGAHALSFWGNTIRTRYRLFPDHFMLQEQPLHNGNQDIGPLHLVRNLVRVVIQIYFDTRAADGLQTRRCDPGVESVNGFVGREIRTGMHG